MSRLQRILAIALAASVALNLFAVGVFVSRHLLESSHFKSDWAAKREAVQVLAEPERQRVEAIWERDRGALKEEFRALREVRRQFRDLLTAESFDPAAAQAALEEISLRKDAARAAIETKILEIATGLPDSQRRAYFTAFFEQERQRDAERERREREE